MFMVILGAGASHDVSASHPFNQFSRASDWDVWRPPLANDLFRDKHSKFADIVQRYPDLSPILGHLRMPAGNRSVEEELELLLSEGEGRPESERELVSVRYYLQEMIQRVNNQWHHLTSGASNYGALARRLAFANKNREPIVFVTFNYDILLELGLHAFDRFRIQAPKDYLDGHEIFKVLKLHGSMNWWRVLTEPRSSGESSLGSYEIISAASTIKLSDDFVSQDPRNNTCVFPAIGIPLQTKKSFECPPMHLKYLEESLPLVRRLMIIGWQAKEAHFIRMLRGKLTNLTHLMVVGKDEGDSSSVLNYFVGQTGISMSTDGVSYGKAGFSEFVLNREGAKFFAS